MRLTSISSLFSVEIVTSKVFIMLFWPEKETFLESEVGWTGIFDVEGVGIGQEAEASTVPALDRLEERLSLAGRVLFGGSEQGIDSKVQRGLLSRQKLSISANYCTITGTVCMPLRTFHRFMTTWHVERQLIRGSNPWGSHWRLWRAEDIEQRTATKEKLIQWLTTPLVRSSNYDHRRTSSQIISSFPFPSLGRPRTAHWQSLVSFNANVERLALSPFIYSVATMLRHFPASFPQ
jgi:hypothetical protein